MLQSSEVTLPPINWPGAVWIKLLNAICKDCMSLILNATKGLNAHKGRLFNTFFALAAISFAHYAGFIMELPLQIMAASGGALVTGVTATFVFYVALCAVVSRVGIGMVQPFLLLFLVGAGRAEQGYRLASWKKKRKFVRSYNNLMDNEGYYWLGAQVLFFVTLMPALYLKFTLTWKSGLGLLIVLLFISLAVLFRARFLLSLSWTFFMRRFKKRTASKTNVASALFVTIASALVVASFIMGSMRMAFLKSAQPQQITNEYFTGYANLIASSGSSTLLYEHADGKARYIYATPSYALAVESAPKSFALLNRK